MATSATGGYLSPELSSTSIMDVGLINIIHNWLSGVSGLPLVLVRPRWQPEPPTLPGATITWMAFGIDHLPSDTFPSVTHYGEEGGYSIVGRQEHIQVSVTTYGPEAQEKMGLLRDGMVISQNRDYLQAQGLEVLNSGTIVFLPELVKNIWLYRTDMRVVLCRRISNRYPILNMQSITPPILFPDRTFL